MSDALAPNRSGDDGPKPVRQPETLHGNAPIDPSLPSLATGMRQVVVEMEGFLGLAASDAESAASGATSAPGAPASAVTLSVLEGPHAGRIFKFDRHDTFLVGRAPEAHFHLPDDPYFSRLHMLIELNPPFCRLTDLGSRNGTLVNDRKMPATRLNHGDRIRAGQTLFLVSIAGQTSAVTLDLPAEPRIELPVIPGFTILEKLGSGGMGVVYRAVAEKDGAIVALKTIKPAVVPTDVVLGRFLREARILQALTHPNIVAFRDMGATSTLVGGAPNTANPNKAAFRDMGATGGMLYFAMEFVPGTDANGIVKKSGPLAVRQAVEVMAQVLQGLGYAHERGIVHRDIKPANILVVDQDGPATAKIADFGLARIYQTSQMSGLTMSNDCAGTPLFMPPEQVTDFRSVKPDADQYSAAATLYYLLTGKGPHETAKLNELFKKILLEEPPPLRSRRPDVPVALEKVVQRALSRQPGQRFADVGAFRKAILEAR